MQTGNDLRVLGYVLAVINIDERVLPDPAVNQNCEQNER